MSVREEGGKGGIFFFGGEGEGDGMEGLGVVGCVGREAEKGGGEERGDDTEGEEGVPGKGGRDGGEEPGEEGGAGTG